jgi:hypothetical protein
MGTAVAQQKERVVVFIVWSNHPDLSTLLKRAVEIDNFIVELDPNRLLRKAGGNRFSELLTGSSLGVFSDRAVGELEF